MPHDPAGGDLVLGGRAAAYGSARGVVRAGLGMPPAGRDVAEGEIQPDGRFAVALPAALPPDAGLTSPAALCAGVGFSPAELRVGILPILAVTDATGAPIGHLVQGSGVAALGGAAGERVVARWYADRAGRIAGTHPCGQGGKPITFDLRLAAGWNVVVVDFVSDAEERISTAPEPADAAWHFVAAAG